MASSPISDLTDEEIDKDMERGSGIGLARAQNGRSSVVEHYGKTTDQTSTSKLGNDATHPILIDDDDEQGNMAKTPSIKAILSGTLASSHTEGTTSYEKSPAQRLSDFKKDLQKSIELSIGLKVGLFEKQVKAVLQENERVKSRNAELEQQSAYAQEIIKHLTNPREKHDVSKSESSPPSKRLATTQPDSEAKRSKVHGGNALEEDFA